jgi:hypothetical protein
VSSSVLAAAVAALRRANAPPRHARRAGDAAAGPRVRALATSIISRVFRYVRGGTMMERATTRTKYKSLGYNKTLAVWAV